MIGITSKGDTKRTEKFLKDLMDNMFSDLEQYGEMGIAALSAATPEETGLTSDSWGYRVIRDAVYPGIEWYNTNLTRSGIPVAILIQYGHGTGTGGYVAGRDFINPAMRHVFDQIAIDIWKKVST